MASVGRILKELDARRLAEEKLTARMGDVEVVIVDATEYPVAWVYFWNTARFVTTGDHRDALTGNSPVLVDRRDGTVHFTGTGRPIDEYVERYLNRDPTDERSWHP